MTEAQTGRWYMVNRDGMATLCTDRADAEKEAADAQSVWPHMGPHRAVQLAPAGDMAKLKGQRAVLCSLLGECLPVIDALMQMPGDDDSDAHLNGLAGRINDARITELESQLAQRFDAADMATASAQGDALDAVRYRFLRDGEWRGTDLEPFIRLQLNTLWDAKIDAARAAQGFMDGRTAAQAISAEPAGATEMENLQRTAVGWQGRALRAERNWAVCRRWAIAGGAPVEKLGDDPDQPFHAASPAIEGEQVVALPSRRPGPADGESNG